MNSFASALRKTRAQTTRLDLVLPPDVEAAARSLAERESACCSFFTFEFEPAGDDVVMHISVPPEHVEVLDALEARVSCDVTETVVVRIKPGSRKGPLVEVGDDGELTIYVRERAVEGKANEAVIKLLAAHLDVPRSRLKLVSGATSRVKRFRLKPRARPCAEREHVVANRRHFARKFTFDGEGR